MKTSELDAVQALLNEVQISVDATKSINESTAVKFYERSLGKECGKKSYSLSDSIGSAIKNAALAALEQRKQTHIRQLLDKYSVAYDGD